MKRYPPAALAGFLLGSLLLILSAVVSRADIPVPDEPGIVGYNPLVKIAQGNQPYSESYVLQITMPATIMPGVSIPISFDVVSTTRPDGVAAEAALAVVNLSTPVVVVSQPGQTVQVVVSLNLPVGASAGSYSWKLTTRGWPAESGAIMDSGHIINGVFIAPVESDTSTPAIELNSPVNGTVYTYEPVSGVPVTVPIDFVASVSATGQPIRGLSAFVNGDPVDFVATGLNTQNATGVGAVQLTAPGYYTISANATNLHGTSTASSEVSVLVSAPPPTITVNSPSNAAAYQFTLGGTGVSVPVSATVNSQYGNVTAVGATLNGNPVDLATAGVGTSTTAQASASLTITTPGTYSLQFTAANQFGDAIPVTVPFSVVGVMPAPTVSIQSPADGSVFNRTQGDPATVVDYFFTAASAYGSITSVTTKLDGQVITPTVTVLPSGSVSGTGTFSFSAGGSHTLVVEVSNGQATASSSNTFVVQEAPTGVCRDLLWLPPISLNKTVQGGSTVPIKFSLSCNGRAVADSEVVIAIYEILADGSATAPTLYPFGVGSPNPPDYAITGERYHLNFATAPGRHHYRIEVYTTVGGRPYFIDSRDLFTKG
jgi:hypothetical protein